MPKLHNIGPKHFFQYIDFPVQWGTRIWVRGWTQEISAPFRTSEPIIIRLPFHKALVIGKWTGQIDSEEEALNRAIQRRDVTYDDFTEEAGWTPAAVKIAEEGFEDIDT